MNSPGVVHEEWVSQVHYDGDSKCEFIFSSTPSLYCISQKGILVNSFSKASPGSKESITDGGSGRLFIIPHWKSK